MTTLSVDELRRLLKYSRELSDIQRMVDLPEKLCRLNEMKAESRTLRETHQEHWRAINASNNETLKNNQNNVDELQQRIVQQDAMILDLKKRSSEQESTISRLQEKSAPKQVDGNALVNAPEEDLYQLLAFLATNSDLSSQGSLFDENGVIDDRVRSKEGPTLGRRIFMRWSVAFNMFICKPDQEDAALRSSVVSAIFGRDVGGSAVIIGALVSTFSISPILAAAIAALLLKLIIAPAVDELCVSWSQFNGS